MENHVEIKAQAGLVKAEHRLTCQVYQGAFEEYVRSCQVALEKYKHSNQVAKAEYNRSCEEAWEKYEHNCQSAL